MAVLFLVVGVVLLLSFFSDEQNNPSLSKKQVENKNNDSNDSSVDDVGTYIEYRIVYKGVEYKATNKDFATIEEFYNSVKSKYNDTLKDDDIVFENATSLADYGLFVNQPMPSLSIWAVNWEETLSPTLQKDYASYYIQLCKEYLSLLQSRDGFFPKKLDKRIIEVGKTYYVYLDDLIFKVYPMYDLDKGNTGMVLAIKFVYQNGKLVVFVDNAFIANFTNSTRSWFKRLSKELNCNANSQSIVYHMYKFDFFCEFPIELIDVEKDEKQVSE